MNSEVFYNKKLILKILQHSQQKTCLGVSFLIKIKAFRRTAVLKRNFNTNVFLTILRNLLEQLF